MKFIKDNLISLIVLVLVAIIFLQRCSEVGPEPIPPKVVRDTVWVVKDSVVNSKPNVIKTITVSSHDTIINRYIPDTNYAKLVLQYQDVVNQLLAKNIMQDSIRIDTNGYVKIIDTVQKNLVIGRSTKVNIKYPIIKETITIYPKPKTQFYVGGELGGTQTGLINQIRAGALLKNKKDQIYGASVGINTSGQIIYGIGSYWKISFKK